ncbi:MAG: hypothetical protein DKM50_01355 [Candidatus Margulisiibacteriota bacterium]|nr:MAG: hypothetical protein A2X42_12475 [Candidatus Margulisbacteria bacterium GWF2_38_17]OGI09217.1 MAG: hypothetical protein A2X41_01415 [Candidatus Margulisbacteria bacterium GWE2_39_32]PZM83749.1 MAG: hypothetical protein DKM50_01355 [Candidatus Margulisiibacteriota bacterium]HCT83863.1 hypothetical protein [Candidatus Margulisiibacteriota bacterium]HCY36764.1 hypothetical protein [Candidatus Margulisiibacteriota bacterium]
MNYKNQRGFTLIELIAVIIILGILAVISVPKFLDLTNKSKKAQCDANIGAIHSAVALKYAENASNAVAAFPTTLTGALFADGLVPTCPFSVAYSYDNTVGRVATPDHAHL